MKKILTLIPRLLLGLVFLVFGGNGLAMVLTGASFFPMPENPPAVQAQMDAFFTIGYLMPLVKGLEVFSAILLITNRFVNLAITLLGPIVVNIMCVHLFINADGLPIGAGITALYFLVLFGRWSSFKGLLRA